MRFPSLNRFNRFRFEKDDVSFDIDYYVYDDPRGSKIRKGAFKKIRNRYPVLYQYDLSYPMGICEVTDMGDYLNLKGQLNMSVQKSRDFVGAVVQYSNKDFDHVDVGVSYDIISKNNREEAVEARIWNFSFGIIDRLNVAPECYMQTYI